MNEEPKYKIGEVAEMLSLKTHVLRFWETEFSQLEPLRTESGQRLYTEDHVALLRRIQQLLHEQGMTIGGAKRLLSGEGTPEEGVAEANISEACALQFKAILTELESICQILRRAS